MKEKGEENNNSQNLKDTAYNLTSKDDIKPPPVIINPELQSIKQNSNNNNKKIEITKEKDVEKFKVQIPNRQNIVYNEDVENLIDISNEIINWFLSYLFYRGSTCIINRTYIHPNNDKL